MFLPPCAPSRMSGHAWPCAGGWPRLTSPCGELFPRRDPAPTRGLPRRTPVVSSASGTTQDEKREICRARKATLPSDGRPYGECRKEHLQSTASGVTQGTANVTNKLHSDLIKPGSFRRNPDGDHAMSIHLCRAVVTKAALAQYLAKRGQILAVTAEHPASSRAVQT